MNFSQRLEAIFEAIDPRYVQFIQNVPDQLSLSREQAAYLNRVQNHLNAVMGTLVKLNPDLRERAQTFLELFYKNVGAATTFQEAVAQPLLRIQQSRQIRDQLLRVLRDVAQTIPQLKRGVSNLQNYVNVVLFKDLYRLKRRRR